MDKQMVPYVPPPPLPPSGVPMPYGSHVLVAQAFALTSVCPRDLCKPVPKKKKKAGAKYSMTIRDSKGKTVLKGDFKPTTTAKKPKLRPSTGEMCKVCRKVARVGFYGCCSKECQLINKM